MTLTSTGAITRSETCRFAGPRRTSRSPVDVSALRDRVAASLAEGADVDEIGVASRQRLEIE
jgi:hypothetical protein